MSAAAALPWLALVAGLLAAAAQAVHLACAADALRRRKGRASGDVEETGEAATEQPQGRSAEDRSGAPREGEGGRREPVRWMPEALAGWPWGGIARTCAGLCAAFVVAAFLWLLWSFVAVDLSLRVVHLYTARDLALRWRIAGTWTGQEGSLLLWCAWTALVVAMYGWRVHNRPARDSDEAEPGLRTDRDEVPDVEADTLVGARDVTFGVLLLLLLPMLWAVARQGTFAATPGFLLQGLPDGNGLNPTLRSSFILIHPPLMFLAYALTSVPAAAALGHLATGHHAWSRAGGTWARADWMLYTVAMGLGAMWAYVTLNFGGYWAWDPVEVANLLPWLALTVFLHAQVRHLRSGEFASLGPILALLPWVLTLFSTLSTRSGLWVSVHAFTDPTQTFRPDPLQRFQDILAAEPGLVPYVGLILGTLAAALGLWSLRLAADTRNAPGTGGSATDDLDPGIPAAAPPAPEASPQEQADVPAAAAVPPPTTAPQATAPHDSPAQQDSPAPQDSPAQALPDAAGRPRKGIQTTARVTAILFGALAGLSFAAPASTLSGLTELAHRISGGRPGMGLLGLLFAAAVLAGLPALLAPDAPRADKAPLWRRIGWPLLARWSVAILGVGLLVMWVWHMAAATGWSTATYEARAPWLALPAVLGLILMQGHRAYGNRQSLYLTGIVLLLGVAAAAAWPPDRGGALLLVTTAALVIVSIDQVRRVAVPGMASRRLRTASLLLLLAALLDLLFWIDPPSRIGAAGVYWHPAWPVPLVPIALSLYALWATVRSLGGAPPKASWHVPLLLVLLGGYGIAPVLAIAGWLLLGRRTAPAPFALRARRNAHRVAVYGVHLAIAIALLGYATTTALRDRDDAVLTPGQSLEVGGLTLTLEGAQASGDGILADRIDARFHVERDGKDAGTTSAPLVWEQRQGAHFPHPGLLRLWDRDLDVAVDRVMFNATAACGSQAIAPGEPVVRMCSGDQAAAVEVRASVLPGLDLLWASVLLMGAAMLVLLRLRKDIR